MNDRQLRYAHVVWREHSFSKAGEKLGVSQPSLSEQIRLLEKELGFELFIRSSRGVDASPRGRTFLDEVDVFITQFNDLKLLARELHGRAGTRVRIGLGHGLTEALVPAIAETLCGDNRRIHPEISTGTTRRILRLLNQQRLDVGFIFQPSIAPARPSLTLSSLAETEIVAIVGAADALANSSPTLAQLAKRRAMLSEPRMGYGGLTLAHFTHHAQPPDVAGYCDDADILKYIVAASGDVAYLPRIAVAQEIADRRVAAIALDPPLKVAIQMARRTDTLPERLERAVEELSAVVWRQLAKSGTRLYEP